MLNQLSYLQCPECKTGNLVYHEDNRYVCGRCRSAYSFLGPNSVNLLRNNKLTEIKKSIQEFWGDMCQQLYSSFDDGLDQAKLLKNLNYLEDMFRQRQHLATTEMKLDCHHRFDSRPVAQRHYAAIGTGRIRPVI